MKKALMFIGGFLGILVVVIGVLGVIAPKDFKVEREVTINKPKSFVFSELKQVKKHNNWSPWAKKDPNIKTEFKGEDGTVGFISAWSGNSDVGEGEQEIKNIVDGEKIEMELRFKKPMEDTSSAYLITEAIGDNQTKVKWGMVDTMKFPENVFCMVMNMQAMLAKDFDQGLASLKSQLEQ